MSKEEAMKNNMTLYNPETGYSDGTDGSLTEGNLYLFNDPLYVKICVMKSLYYIF